MTYKIQYVNTFTDENTQVRIAEPETEEPETIRKPEPEIMWRVCDKCRVAWNDGEPWRVCPDCGGAGRRMKPLSIP